MSLGCTWRWGDTLCCCTFKTALTLSLPALKLYFCQWEVSCPGSAFHALPVLGMHPLIRNSSDNVGLGAYCHGALSGLGILFAGSLSCFLPAAQLQRAPGTDFNSEQVPRAPWPWPMQGGHLRAAAASLGHSRNQSPGSSWPSSAGTAQGWRKSPGDRQNSSSAVLFCAACRNK